VAFEGAMQNKLIPPRYLNLFLLVPIALHFILPIKSIIHAPHTYVGILFILLGVALNAWSVAQLRKNHTTVDFHGTPNELVIGGPFRLSRNPIYLSGVTLSFGVAILLGSLITFVFPIALFAVLNAFYIPVEELALENTFGNSYLQYKRKARRWI
jgi:protein-S-isoprenylcysteine O-methyltransferase Ste14